MNKKLDDKRTALFGPPEEAKLRLVRLPLGSLVVGLPSYAKNEEESQHFQRLASTNVTLHELALVPFGRLVTTWLEAGLLSNVLSFDRFYEVAEDGKRWGAHAWGNSFDINTEHNKLRTAGALPGTHGSTHELEHAAKPLGWVCGRVWPMGRAPKHFELLTLERPPAPEVDEESARMLVGGPSGEL